MSLIYRRDLYISSTLMTVAISQLRNAYQSPTREQNRILSEIFLIFLEPRSRPTAKKPKCWLSHPPGSASLWSPHGADQRDSFRKMTLQWTLLPTHSWSIRRQLRVVEVSSAVDWGGRDLCFWRHFFVGTERSQVYPLGKVEKIRREPQLNAWPDILTNKENTTWKKKWWKNGGVSFKGSPHVHRSECQPGDHCDAGRGQRKKHRVSSAERNPEAMNKPHWESQCLAVLLRRAHCKHHPLKHQSMVGPMSIKSEVVALFLCTFNSLPPEPHPRLSWVQEKIL